MIWTFLVCEWYKLTGHKRAERYLWWAFNSGTENQRTLAGMALHERKDR